MDADKTRYIVYNAYMKKLTLIIFILSLVLSACDFNEETPFVVEKFWATNFKTNANYRVDAELLYTGTYCEIWAEKGSGVTVTDARAIADEYDNKIYQKMISAFSSSVNYRGYSFPNTMSFADWSGDNNGKLCILLLDIKDNYQKDVNEAYVAGYFWGGNFLNGASSNLRDMIYIDTNPGLNSESAVEEAYRTLAHEMQHLMNFVTSYAVGRSAYMDTWIDEGLSSAAEYVYSGDHSTDRIDWFKYNGGDYDNFLDRGNNFFVWDNHEEITYAIMDDYSTVYLFFQWLRLQSGGTAIYKNIISSPHYDHQAVVNSINGYSDWDTLLKTWLAANYINASSGAYGYKGEAAFNEMKAPTAPTGVTSLNLYPGEAVYSKASTNPNPSGQGPNITNAYLTSSDLSDSFKAGTLLTYNKNTALNGAAEKGVTTGAAASVVMDVQSVSQGRSVTGARLSGPFRIDAGDLLRRNGRREFRFNPADFVFNLGKTRRAEADE